MPMQATPPCRITSTLWKHLLLQCGSTLVFSESSHIMGELPHVFQVFSFMGRFQYMSWKSSHWWEDWLCTGSRHINLLNYTYYSVAVVVLQLILCWILLILCLELARLNGHAGYPTMWENFHVVEARTSTMWEYSRILRVIAQHGRTHTCLPSLLIHGKIPIHVVEVFTLTRRLIMYGKSAPQSLKVYLLFCGCCCSTSHSVLMAP